MPENRNRRRRGRRTFGSVERLPSGRYRASYRAPDGKRRYGPHLFAEVAAADAWLATVLADITRGDWRPPEPSKETFGDYGQRWLASRPDLRPSTQERYKRLWRIWLEPTFGKMPLGAMTPERWRTWFTTCRTEHPSSTQPAAAYRLARAMLSTAVEDGLLRVNPCQVKGAGRVVAPERPIAMPDEVGRIVEAIDARYRAMVMLAAYGSMRFGELAALRRQRVDLLHRTIRVEENAVELSSGRTVFGPPKSEAGRRTVAIPDEIVPMIEAHLAEHVPPCPKCDGSGEFVDDGKRCAHCAGTGVPKDALVFTSPEGHPLRRTKFRPRWIEACEKAGVAGLHFHDLRGSGSTWAAQAGATLAELMARLGHSTPNMAMRYQHATAERDRAIADRLGALLRAAEATDQGPSAKVREIGERQ